MYAFGSRGGLAEGSAGPRARRGWRRGRRQGGSLGGGFRARFARFGPHALSERYLRATDRRSGERRAPSRGHRRRSARGHAFWVRDLDELAERSLWTPPAAAATRVRQCARRSLHLGGRWMHHARFSRGARIRARKWTTAARRASRARGGRACASEVTNVPMAVPLGHLGARAAAAAGAGTTRLPEPAAK